MIEKTFEFGIPVVGGVAFDGEDVWFSDPANKAIARVDRETGEVKKRLRGPKVGSGTAWDGTHLWQIGGDGIQRVDPETGAVTRTLPLPSEGFLTGLAWDGEALWVGSYEGKRLQKLDPESGEVLRTLESDRFVTGITWIGDELWHAVAKTDGQSAELRHVDAASGEVRERVPVPHQVSGMAHDGERLWCGDCDEGKLRAHTLARPSRQATPRSGSARRERQHRS